MKKMVNGKLVTMKPAEVAARLAEEAEFEANRPAMEAAREEMLAAPTLAERLAQLEAEIATLKAGK